MPAWIPPSFGNTDMRASWSPLFSLSTILWYYPVKYDISHKNPTIRAPKKMAKRMLLKYGFCLFIILDCR